jgi:CubicO group peptidase (beta-lactamase class C family)
VSDTPLEEARYPSDADSDPTLLGWMKGSPPQPDKVIRFIDDHHLEFPQIRWSLSHLRELISTVNVPHGVKSGTSLGKPLATDEQAIDELSFVDLNGVKRRFADFPADTYTDGLAILHRGRLVYERYRGALGPELPHACFSITKSYVGTLAAMLIHDGVLDDARTVSHYVPEMAGAAHGDATLRQVLDMQVGAVYSEYYADPRSPFWAYTRAGGLRPQSSEHEGPRYIQKFLQSLRKRGNHGDAFNYRSVDTDVLCWVMSRITGLSLADLLSQRLWRRIGCEQDAYLVVDSLGTGMGGAGLSATLRDIARFGELLRHGGATPEGQVIPETVVADLTGGGDKAKFAAAGYTLLPGFSYHNMWWITHNEHEAFEGRGIHGQRLYVAPRAELVVARFASHPVAASAANDPITIPALLALGRMLRG